MRWTQDQGRRKSLDWKDLGMFEAREKEVCGEEQLIAHKGEGNGKFLMRQGGAE